MQITSESIATEQDRFESDVETYVKLINNIRDYLGHHFDESVKHVDREIVLDELQMVLEDPDRAVNIVALSGMLRTLDIEDDYPGFIIDEQLGQLLARTIAGGEPQATLATATFHYIDLFHDRPTATAGMDDLDAAMAAGLQTRLPGWDWQGGDGPFTDLE